MVSVLSILTLAFPYRSLQVSVCLVVCRVSSSSSSSLLSLYINFSFLDVNCHFYELNISVFRIMQIVLRNWMSVNLSARLSRQSVNVRVHVSIVRVFGRRPTTTTTTKTGKRRPTESIINIINHHHLHY